MSSPGPLSDAEWYEWQRKNEEERRKREAEKKEEESPKYTVSGTNREGKLERRTGLSREEARRLSQEQLSRGYRSTSYEREGAIPESKAQKFAEESAQSAQERKHRRVKSIAHLFFGGDKKDQAGKARPPSSPRHHQGKKAASVVLKFFDEATKPRKASGKKRLTKYGRIRKARRHKRRRKRYGPRRLWK